MNRVQATPPLPYPDGQTLIELAQFDKDMRKALYQYLTSLASRLNGVMPKDGSEPFTGSLNIFNDTDISSITQLTAPLNIGTYAGNNMMIDGNELQTRTNGVASSWMANLFGGNITFGDTSTIFALNGGKIKFPATQQASSDANTLDDYEEGAWTPTVTFDTPGNLSVTYAAQSARYIKIGKQVFLSFHILTATFTHTTASGTLRIGGIPFTVATIDVNAQFSGSIELSGITFNGGRTTATSNTVSANTQLRIVEYGSALARRAMDATNTTTGTNLDIMGSISYEAAS